MPIYAYQAIDHDGRTRKGVLEADSAKTARSQLRAQALVPLEVRNAHSGEDPGQPATMPRRALRGQALINWTQQLGSLLEAGLPLERALAALADEAEGSAAELVATLRAEVNAGSSLARAMAQHPRDFDVIYVAVVAAAEQSGQLSGVLQNLGQDLEEQQALRARLLGAALYPAIVSVVALVIVLFLLTYVVPQVAQHRSRWRIRAAACSTATTSATN